MTTERRPIDSIVVGERRRKDMGDIAGLAASIERHGLIHPIVIDDDGRLVAGGRRLEAARSLRWTHIDCRPFGTLSETERRVIELEENLQRKDLASAERDATIVALAEAAAAVDEVLFVKSVDDQNVTDKRTRNAEKPGSLRRTAERIGMSPENLRRAQLAHEARQKNALPPDTPREEAIVYEKRVQTDPSLAGKPLRDVVGESPRSMRGRGRATVPDAAPPEVAPMVSVAAPSTASSAPTPSRGEAISRARRRSAFLTAAADLCAATRRINPEELPEFLGQSDWPSVKNLLWEMDLWSERLRTVWRQGTGEAS